MNEYTARRSHFVSNDMITLKQQIMIHPAIINTALFDRDWKFFSEEEWSCEASSSSLLQSLSSRRSDDNKFDRYYTTYLLAFLFVRLNSNDWMP